MKNVLREIEETYPVNTILVNGEQVWPHLRITYFARYSDRMASATGEAFYEEACSTTRSLPGRFRASLAKLRDHLYGASNWLGRYHYVAMSDSSERKIINGKYFNKLLDPVIDLLGRDRVLYMELPAPSLHPIGRLHTRRVVSTGLLNPLAELWRMLSERRYTIKNMPILLEIQKKYDLEIDDLSAIRYFDSKREVFRLLFRMIKPKALLLSDYYSLYNAAVKAAKDLGITVIEFQHGVIGKEHPAYNVGCDLDRSYFPDHLLVFGRHELATFDNSRFIDPANVHPVGSFYIDYMRSSCGRDPRLSELASGYRTVIGVTLQWTSERRLIAFVREAAQSDGSVLYLLIPRRPQEKAYASVALPQNVALVTDRGFYDLMRYCDFHSTVNSTCALEAPSLGVQNILINIDNASRRYYGSVLTDGRITRYADTPGQLVEMANTFEKLDRDNIVKLNEHIIATNYERNIQDFIAGHLQR